jgi:SAM-dependent methyltransferase
MQNPDTPENWGAASRGYADNVAPLMMRSFMDEFVDRLGPTTSHDVIEVAAGSGILTETMAPRVKSVLATDFAPGMIEVLRERIAASGIENVTCEVMNGQDLKVEDASFDRAASTFGMIFFPDRVKGFSELRRALRSGGRAMVSGWAGPEKFEGFALFLSGVKAAFPDMPAPPTPPPVFSLANLESFKSEMEAGGFADVEVDLVSRELSLDSFEDLWRMMTVGAPPVQMLFDRLGPDGNAKVHDSLAGIVEKRFGSGPIVVNNVATVGVGNAK